MLFSLGLLFAMLAPFQIHPPLPLHYCIVRRLELFLLPLLPLPLYHDWQEMPKVKFRPQAVQEDDFRLLVTLPKHKVAQSLDPRGPDQQI